MCYSERIETKGRVMVAKRNPDKQDDSVFAEYYRCLLKEAILIGKTDTYPVTKTNQQIYALDWNGAKRLQTFEQQVRFDIGDVTNEIKTAPTYEQASANTPEGSSLHLNEIAGTSTARELLSSCLVGLWATRHDIKDSVKFARSLRQKEQSPYR